MAKYKFLLFIALFSFLSSFGQLTPMTAFQYGFKRIVVDSTLQIPSFCGVPTLRNSTVKNGALAMDTCANKLYKYTRAAGWSEVSGGGGGGSQDLQSVTDEGNTTNNQMIVGDGTDSLILSKDAITLFSGTYGGYGSVISALVNSWTYSSNSTSLAPILNGQHNFYLYNSNTSTLTTDTLATLANIRSVSGGSSQNGRFGNDTATVVMAKVHNNSGVQLTNGKVVALSASGTQSNEPAVRLANNKADSTSANTFGFVTGTIAVNDTGWVILSGKIEKLNTSAFSNGDVIYLDSVSGEWTKSKPKAPYHLVYLGVIIKANAGNGAIFVKPQNGYEVDEIHDIQINGIVNNNILVYSDTSKLWKNRSIYSVVDTTNVIATKTNVATKVNISDTATMLSKYLRKTDTSSLSNRINLKVNYTDTASMLTNYVRKDTACFHLTSDVSTSNTTATNTNLTFTIGANETYRIMVAGTCSKATTTTGMKIAIGAPTGCSIKSVIQGGQALVATAPQGQILSAVNTLSTNAFATGAGVEVPFRLEGVITNGANAGSITLQFATVTSNTATIYAGTVMQLIKSKGL